MTDCVRFVPIIETGMSVMLARFHLGLWPMHSGSLQQFTINDCPSCPCSGILKALKAYQDLSCSCMSSTVAVSKLIHDKSVFAASSSRTLPAEL